MEDKIIDIQDLSKLSILGITEEYILFDYDGQLYKLAEGGAVLDKVALYKVTAVKEDSTYKLKDDILKTRRGSFDLKNYFPINKMEIFFEDKYKVRFIKALVADGFSKGLYEKEYQEHTELLGSVQSDLEEAERMIEHHKMKLKFAEDLFWKVK